MKLIKEEVGFISFSDLVKKIKTENIQSINILNKFNKGIVWAGKFKKILITSEGIKCIGYQDSFEIIIPKLDIKEIQDLGFTVSIITKSFNQYDISFVYKE
jgi:oligoribonuclease NrnB/cAMP/cGMP phosphodiesterase (DHH superfamily)